MSDDLFAPEGGWVVRILDLSGGAEDNIVEDIGGFATIMHANAFARRYVRNSVERCRAPGMSAKDVLDAWFAFGEDAEVLDAAGRWLAQRHRAGRFRRPPGRRGGARLARPRSPADRFGRGGRTDGRRADGRRTGRMIAVRFAPSPTGYLHVGNSRAALANYLFARRHGGRFLLRLDDTDQEPACRNTPRQFPRICAGWASSGTRCSASPTVWTATQRRPSG